jgi:hypothetical protein
MRAVTMVVVLGAAILLAGCVSSLHPLYTPKDVVFDPSLVGVWTEKDSNDTWEFAKSEDNVYELTYTTEGEPAKFKAHLVRLGKSTFLDTFPEVPEPKNTFYAMHMVPTHFFMKVRMDKDKLLIAPLDPEWLGKQLKSKKVKIAHETVEDWAVLTAPTPELQKFAVRCAGTAGAFVKPTELHRQK